MPNPRSRLARLATAGAFVASRLRASAVPDEPAGFADAVAGLPAGAARATAIVALRPGTDWLDTGIDVAPGETVTILGHGRLWMSQRLGIGCGARVALWHRLGAAGRIAKALGDSTTFVAEAGGTLQLATKPPGEWLDERGRFDPTVPRRGMRGQLDVAIVVWRAADGLSTAAAANPHGLFAREETRRATAPALPPGWEPLWRIGGGSIYRGEAIDGRAAMTCRTHGDVGIVRRPVDLALDDDTRLAWSWRVHDLPSALPEDLTPTHDYLSIAVEFENGRDLTYLWSSGLQVGTSFHCPLAWWSERESHLVVRSGRQGLGQWLDEERTVLADYRAVIGGPPPARLVAVWLIAVSVFQQRAGACDYGRIAVASAGRSIDLL